MRPNSIRRLRSLRIFQVSFTRALRSIEKPKIPGFADVRRAALSAGALGCSISGAGPTTFAWCLDGQAAAVREAMVQEFARHGLKTDHWITPVAPIGARVID